jgi:hypothetical protein
MALHFILAKMTLPIRMKDQGEDHAEKGATRYR